MTDDDWITTAGGTTAEFRRRYQEATGVKLQPT
jgi:hypothetical protein